MDSSTDVLMIGGGLAGTTAAHALGARGVRVTLVDVHDVVPAVFKAEKAGPHSLPQMQRLGIGNALDSVSRRLSESYDAAHGRILRRMQLGERGYSYHDLVNQIRREFSPQVTFVRGSVRSIEQGPELQRVQLACGDTITCRLLVLACGASSHLFEQLGIGRRPIVDSMAVGFAMHLEPGERDKFWFDGACVTYYPRDASSRISYCSMFSIPGAMRVNMFGFHEAKSQWVRELQADPRAKLMRAFPKLTRVTGDFRVVGKVELMPIRCNLSFGYRRPGFVLIGDAFSTVPPSTGKGVYKLMHDVEVLVGLVPGWLATPAMGLEKINTYYDHPQKIESDALALEKTRYQHWAATSPTTRAQVHRLRFFADAYVKDLVGYTADLN